LMPGARVIDRHIGGRGQSAFEQRIFFHMEGILANPSECVGWYASSSSWRNHSTKPSVLNSRSHVAR
jgi:hypothetical protein